MVDANLFIALIILAITQLVKKAFPAISGWLTVVVALLIGLLIAVVDIHIGVTDVSIAGGIVSALGAVGISVAAEKAGGSES